jgi:membrane protease YdiL (CAAX protease family)
MKAHDIFFGTDGKLRSGWRFAIFVAAYIFVSVLIALIVGALVFGFALQGSSLFLVSSIASLIPALVLGWLCGKFLERLPFKALGASFTAGWFKHFLIGSLLGSATLSFAVAIAAVFGDLHFSFSGAAAYELISSALLSFLIFAAAAAFEEALFRGYILQTFARSGLAWFAIIITSVFFGIVHLYNPNANYFAAANTVLAGIWFGVAYLKTRDLWLVWGLHLFWNWMQGSIFGIEVSGLTDIVTTSLLKESDHGPAWLTGENYGIEASIACTVALLASTVAIHFMPGLKPSEEMIELQKPELQKPARQ